MLEILILTLCGNLALGSGDSGLSPPYTCTTTTTLCEPGETRENHLSLNSGSQTQIGRPGKRGIRGPKGEKGDSCGCDGGQTSNNLPQPTVDSQVAVKGAKGNKGEPGRSAPTNETELEEMRRRIDKLESDIMKVQKSSSSISAETEGGDSSGRLSQFPAGCSDLKSRGGSDLDRAIIYPMLPFHDITPYVVNCSGGGWITIQRRMDGSVNFYRNWREYADGFGNKDGEFWLGLRNIHRLTSQKPYELYIDMKRRDNGASMYARYGVFFVDNEASKFRLVVGDYSGSYSDNLRYHNGMPFSTKDQDLDESSSNCAQTYKGAWWYKSCYNSNLNGQYSGNYMIWTNYLSFAEMRIRPRC